MKTFSSQILSDILHPYNFLDTSLDSIGKTFLYGDTKYMDTEGKVYTYDMGDYDHNYSIKYYFEAKQGGVFADYGNVLIYGY